MVVTADLAGALPRKVEGIIAKGGFDAPLLACQTLMIHMWHARRAG